MHKKIVCFCLIMLMVLPGLVCRAETVSYAPYQGYEYNDADMSQLAPIGYLPETQLFNNGIETDISLDGVTAISTAFDKEGAEWYFLTFSSKAKVLRLNSKFEVYDIYDDFTDTNGNALDISHCKAVEYDFNNQKYIIRYKDYVIVTDAKRRAQFSLKCFNAMAILKNDEIIVFESSDSYKTYNYDGENTNSVKLPFSASALSYDSSSNTVFALTGNKVINLETSDEIVLPFFIKNGVLFSNNGGDTFYAVENDTKQVVKATAFDGSSGLGIFSDFIMGFDSVEQRFIVIKEGKMFLFDEEFKHLNTIDKLYVCMLSPSDMLVSGDSLYILDSGNSRILETDISVTKVLNIYSTFVDESGNSIDFTNAKGMNIASNGDFLIADTENYRMIHSSKKGIVEHIITKPENLIDDDTPFRVSDVLEDRNGKLYLITDATNMGAFVFNTDYTFDNYYGSNTVIKTGTVILNYIKRKFMTRAQIENSMLSTPVSLRSFCIDDEGFIYTVSATDQTSFTTAEIRKLNYSSSNILETREISGSFGDLEWDRQKETLNTSFCDISVDAEGFINLIDSSRGKIFQYSPEGQLVCVFGGLGTQIGLFKEPVAVQNVGEYIYVLDSFNANITKFKPTDYSATLREAMLMLDDADGSKALEIWQDILAMNTNSLYPYYGIGIAQQTLGNYKEAMENFKLCNAKTEYSNAFKLYRTDFLKKNIWWMCLIAVFAIALIVVVKKAVQKKLVKQGETYSFLESKAGLPLYVLFHPIDGFEQLKYRSLHSWKYSVGAVVSWFLISVLSFFCTGFIFNENRALDYNLLMTLCTTVILFVLFVLANWCIASFMDGKGKMKDIIVVTAYSLLPMLVSMLINVVLSNVLCIQEGAFIGIVSAIGYIWTGFILIMGMYAIHSYSFTKTVISVILSVLVVLIIVLLIALLFTMMQQVASFIESIVYEIKIR